MSTIEFLERWRPGGPWVLTAVEREGHGIETATFREAGAIVQWLTKYNEWNHYFHVNPTTRDLTNKAARTDIEALWWLHVDIDPRVGKDFAAERERALKLLLSPPGGVPVPTIIIDSGGGFQGFWELEEPVLIGGDLTTAEDAKRYNLQLELLFEADNCHNVDRIMRLPGTINRPNKRKRDKGRVDAPAKVVRLGDERHPIGAFTKAPEVQAGDMGFAGKHVMVSGNVKRLASVDELDVPDWVKVIVVQGNRPDDEEQFASRSEALFTVCCQMVRAKIDDDTIYAVITDPDFGISASVLDKRGGIERYAIRQIERAHEEAIDPGLRLLNDKHAVIADIGGKCRVVSETYDPAMDRMGFSQQSFGDFANRYGNQRVQVGWKDKAQTIPAYEPLGKWWLNHEDRRQYETMVFVPGRDIDGAYNLWRGFACESRPGDCSLFLEHVHDNICSGVEEHYDYLVKWMATAVQHPASPAYSAVVLKGEQGTGKGKFASTFGSLWGRHFMHVSDAKHLVGNFNSHLRDCVVLYGDEAFWAGDKKHEGVLKTLITEKTLIIEAKGYDIMVALNCVHLIMASNEAWVVPAGYQDRRFFVLSVPDTRREDHAYFNWIDAQMNAGGREALLHYLMIMDLDSFNVRNVPKTDALTAQKEMSLGTEAEWWLGKLIAGRLLTSDDEWKSEATTYDLTYDFAKYTERFARNQRSNSCRLGRFLTDICAGKHERQQRRRPVEATMLDGKKQTVRKPWWYLFPGLDECREIWETKFGPYKWPDGDIVDDRDDKGEY